MRADVAVSIADRAVYLLYLLELAKLHLKFGQVVAAEPDTLAVIVVPSQSEAQAEIMQLKQ